MIPTELVYLVIAFGLGALVYRYFTGRGGMQILRPDYVGLPSRGGVVVRQHEVRWTVADDDSFVAAWQLEDGHIVGLQVAFDRADVEEPDLGRMDILIDQRRIETGVRWTEKIHDRTLRADVEAILKALTAEARRARSDTTRVAAAKHIGDDRRLE